MVLSALVVTLSPAPALRARALHELGVDPRLLIGTPVGNRLPVVAEAASAADGALLCETLATWTGVLRVDVVSIDFEEDA